MMKRSNLPMFFRAAALAVAAAATASFAPAAWADDDAGDLRSGALVQWAYSIPAPVNPLNDLTGQNCMVGQSGSTWYLVPFFGGVTGSRSCTIPHGVKLQALVAGAAYVYAPGYCGDVAGTPDSGLRAAIAGFTDTLKVTVTLDGNRVKAKRVRSEVFATALPADNVFAPFCGASPVPAGVYRSVDDSYYAEVDDLKPGVHTLQLVATNGSSFNQNVVYTLNVLPRLRR
jgi:hypothetical protein